MSARQPEVDLFALLSSDFEQIFGQIVSIRVKTLSHTNVVASRHIKREKSSPPIEVRRSKTLLPKPPDYFEFAQESGSSKSPKIVPQCAIRFITDPAVSFATSSSTVVFVLLLNHSTLTKGDVTRGNSQRRFLAKYSVTMLEQC